MKPARSHALSALAGAGVLALASLLAGMQGSLSKEKVLCLTPEQQEILSHMSIVHLDDGSGNLVNKTIRITGVNVQVVSGAGSTDGLENGVGNVVVGYNELGNFDGDDRTGSHNVVVGRANSYSSHGALVSGTQNTSSATYASVTGGTGNRATGPHASVTGGAGNLSSDYASTVCGGQLNLAGGGLSAVLGGRSNTASGTETVVCSGEANEAAADFAAVLGGAGNLASAPAAVVCGGGDNLADGAVSVVSGGQSNQASHLGSVVSGGCGSSTSVACDHVP